MMGDTDVKDTLEVSLGAFILASPKHSQGAARWCPLCWFIKFFQKPSVTSCVHQASGAPLRTRLSQDAKVKTMGTFIPICSMYIHGAGIFTYKTG